MTAAYAAIANGGTYTKPILYTQVLDHDGNVLLDNTTPETHEVLKDSTAYLLTSAMEDVVNGAGGTGGSASLLPLKQVPARKAATCGFQHLRLIIQRLYGVDMMSIRQWTD